MEQTKRGSVNRLTVTAFILAVVVALAAIGFINSDSNSSTPVYSYRIVNTYPHDPDAFCQGLDFDGQTLFESTGQYGKSTVRRVKLDTGEVEKQLNLDERLFGEGLALIRDRIFQLTWRQGVGYVYDASTLEPQATFKYNGEGWGLTHDGTHLIMSDGTDRLRFMDPNSFTEVRTVRVKDGGQSVYRLNELEFVRGEVFANVWHSNRIARIAPKTGEVTGWIDLSGLLDTSLGPEAVLNGIAYEESSDRLFVTGKNWPQLFEIEVLKQ